MENNGIIRQENPAITKIFKIMDALFLEIRIDGNYMQVPRELRPSEKEISMAEADKAVMSSLAVIREELYLLVDQLAEIDPDFFGARLELFLDKWPDRHPEENLIFFQALKFYLEAHTEVILNKFGRFTI